MLLFVFLLPALVDEIALQYTDSNLIHQKKKVLGIIKKNGINYYLQNDADYGSYTMLKEEYVSLEPSDLKQGLDTVITEERVVELDTLKYRILRHTFRSGNGNYMLEVAKTTASIKAFYKPLQKIALFILVSLVLFAISIDLLTTRYLIRPLDKIIKTKLINRQFPFNEHIPPVKTNTADFKYLDKALIGLMKQINEAFEKEREFTANASHELITPISILKSKIENLMLHEGIDEDVHLGLMEMMKTLTRLKKIVNSLLLISRIDNEQFSRFDTMRVTEFFEELVEEIGDRVEQRGITLKVNVSSTVALNQVNRDLLFQMFCNLVNNAVRYNKPDGSIRIEDQFDSGNYTVRIIDSGIGIPEEELDAVFERFKKTNLAGGAGYGLGLAIVKSIAGYHKLELKIESKVNKGTTVSVTFPVGSFQQTTPIL